MSHMLTTGRLWCTALAVVLAGQGAQAETDPAVIAERVQAIADAYVSDTAPAEKATGISISISPPAVRKP